MTITNPPPTSPTVVAVPAALETARRQVEMSLPLYLTSSGSVARPLDA